MIIKEMYESEDFGLLQIGQHDFVTLRRSSLSVIREKAILLLLFPIKMLVKLNVLRIR